jgi:hypothetical protein
MTFEKPAYHPTISHEEKVYIEEQIGHVSHSVPSVSFKLNTLITSNYSFQPFLGRLF